MPDTTTMLSASMRLAGLAPDAAPAPAATPAAPLRLTGLTTRTFGVELEMFVEVGRAVTELRAAGVAVEREGYNHVTRGYWKFVTDASVRDSVTNVPYLMVDGVRLDAIELVSPILNGEAGLAAIETVCAALNRAGAKVNKTCGLHVHHGAADLTVANIATLARLVNRFETVIDGCLPQSRRKGHNSYCGAFSAHELDTIDSATTKSALFNMHRFKNLNLASLGRHGTVEFRQHSGTTDADKVVAWVMLTQGLVEAAKAKVRARKSRAQRAATADGRDNLLRAAGLRTCKPHGQQVAPAFVKRARAASAYFAARAKEFGVLDVAESSARRSRARRAIEGGNGSAAGVA